MIKLRGYIKDKHNYIIGNYRIWYELAGDKLWVFRKDMAQDFNWVSDEFVTTLNMPSYWWLFLWEGQTDKEKQLKFERYLIEKLGL